METKTRMNKLKNILKTIFNDEKPLRRLLSEIIMRLPFDIGSFLHIKIRVQDYFIGLHQSSLSIAFWFNPNDRISDYKFITSYLKENDIYIDVGANIGTTLIPAANSIKGGKAIGFEPHPKIFSYLKDNISLNNQENSVELHNCALGNERGYLNFSSNRWDDMNKILTEGIGIKIPIKLLDDIGEKYAKIDLIKIDVEGYEKFVILGGIKTLKKTECIYFEISEEQFGLFQYSMKDLLIILENMDFQLFINKVPYKLESINSDYNLSMHHTNAFAIRNIEDFKRRTGWQIYEDRKHFNKIIG